MIGNLPNNLLFPPTSAATPHIKMSIPKSSSHDLNYPSSSRAPPHFWDDSWGSPHEFVTPVFTVKDIDATLEIRNVTREEMVASDARRKKMFQEVYDLGKWVHNKEGVPKSGSGSTLQMTERVRKGIKEAVLKYKIKTFIDAPCGDLFWMKELFPFFDEHGIEYIGVDIVPSEIERHKLEHPTRKFIQSDMAIETLPKADMIFSREALQHMNAEDNLRTLNKWKESGTMYVLLTNYYVTMEYYNNPRITGKQALKIQELGSMNYFKNNDGTANLIELEKHPYNFPEPLEKWVDKGHRLQYKQFVGLWILQADNLQQFEI